MVSSASAVLRPPRVRMGLPARLGFLALLLVIEKIALNFFVDLDAAQRATGLGGAVWIGQRWGLHFLTVLALSLALLGYAGADSRWARINATVLETGIGIPWFVLHGLLLLPLAALTYVFFGTRGAAFPLPLLVTLWLLCALFAVIALARALAPWSVWAKAARTLGILWVYAACAGIVAASAIQWSQQLWGSMAAVTFDAVRAVLLPIIPNLQSDPTRLVLATNRFAVQVSDVCSGLEGAGLLLAFCCAWLVCFRKEYIFPRALLLIPIGLALSFALNALRIATLMLIGHAGFPDVAMYGFHSQAGWIAFNCAAGGLAFASRRSRWLNRNAVASSAAAGIENPTVKYLLPFVAILAAGMLAHAASGGFEYWYGARLIAAAIALMWSLPQLTRLDWRCSWRGPLAGVVALAVWLIAAAALTQHAGMPSPLAAMSPGLRTTWIAARVSAAVITVPISEELAYRGYLMRRLIAHDFESVSFQNVSRAALVVSAAAFGVMHGALWPAGIIAGLIYGAAAKRTGRFGEAVAAHATTNALLAVYVLTTHQWQLW
jgi:exosortase E/protease (VPEID-CTERM system)